MKQVAVMALDGDEDKTLMVVVCLNPLDAYVSKDGKNIGHIVSGKLNPVKDAKFSEREEKLIIRSSGLLFTALLDMVELTPAEQFAKIFKEN
jgi:hypothetical protein